MKNLADAANAFLAFINEHGFRGREIHSTLVDGADGPCDQNNVVFDIMFAQDGIPINDLTDELRKQFGHDCNIELHTSLFTAYVRAYR